MSLTILTRCLQFRNFEYCSCGLDCTWSFAWKDRRALDALSPFILRHIDAFGTHELALILNAHKRLEYDTGQGDKGSQGSSFSVSHCIKHHLPLEGPINYVVLLFSDIQERTDSIHLLVSIICQRKEEWTGQILALTCNAVAHFHIYRPRFWRQASMSLMRLSDLKLDLLDTGLKSDPSTTREPNSLAQLPSHA